MARRLLADGSSAESSQAQVQQRLSISSQLLPWGLARPADVTYSPFEPIPGA